MLCKREIDGNQNIRRSFEKKITTIKQKKWINKTAGFLTHKQAPWTILSALFSQVDQQPVWIGTNVKLYPLYWTIVALFDVVHSLYLQIRSQTRHRSDIKKISDLWLAQVWYLTDNAWLGVHYVKEKVSWRTMVKFPLSNSFLERRDDRRKSSESLGAGASLAPRARQRISLGSENDWKIRLRSCQSWKASSLSLGVVVST